MADGHGMVSAAELLVALRSGGGADAFAPYALLDEEVAPVLAAAADALVSADGRVPGLAARLLFELAGRARGPWPPAACRELLAAAAQAPAAVPPELCVVALAGLAELPPDLAEPAGLVLAALPAGAPPALVLGLAAALPDERRRAAQDLLLSGTGSVLARRELEGLAALPLPALAALAVANGTEVERRAADAWVLLADSPAYLAAAREVLAAAAAHLEAIACGDAPYVADGAFAHEEVVAVERAARALGAARAPEFGPALARALPAVVVAPTAARTAPSQSLAHALASAVVATPTPLAVEALALARSRVRHAGLTKRLDRALSSARRELGRSGDSLSAPDCGFAGGTRRVRLGSWTATQAVTEGGTVRTTWTSGAGRTATSVPASVRRDDPEGVAELRDTSAAARRALTTLRAGLEAALLDAPELPAGRWRDLHRHGLAGALVGRLVWETGRDGEWKAFLPGAAEPDLKGLVRLWHPLRTSADQVARWQDEVLRARVAQPFAQVFRERYPARPDLVAGLVLDLGRLLGLAVRRGWESDDLAGELRLPLGRTGWRVCWSVQGRLFPGAQGDGTAGLCRLERSAGGVWAALPPGDVPLVVVSEALREVDLLAAVSAHAAGHDEAALAAQEPLREQARFRRSALERALRELPEASGVVLTDREAVVPTETGPCRVSLTTALVRDDTGAVIDPPRLTQPPATLPWLPYDDGLFGRVLRAVVALLGARR